jgi:hypothetical protein
MNDGVAIRVCTPTTDRAAFGVILVPGNESVDGLGALSGAITICVELVALYVGCLAVVACKRFVQDNSIGCHKLGIHIIGTSDDGRIEFVNGKARRNHRILFIRHHKIGAVKRLSVAQTVDENLCVCGPDDFLCIIRLSPFGF